MLRLELAAEATMTVTSRAPTIPPLFPLDNDDHVLTSGHATNVVLDHNIFAIL